MRVGNITGICFVIALPIIGAVHNAEKSTASKPTQPHAAKEGYSEITSAPHLMNNSDKTSTQDTRTRQTHGASDLTCASLPPGLAKFDCTMKRLETDPQFRADFEHRLDQILK